MQRILITGGAGFIGSHFTERLLAEGWRVTVLDDLSTGTLSNLAGGRNSPRLEVVEGTILDTWLVRRLVQSSEVVVHLAAAVGVRYILENPLTTIRTNVEGTDNVLKAAAQFGRKTLLASTSEVYGMNPTQPLCEDADSVLGPSSVSRWSYATAKKLDEFLALAYARSKRLPVVILRFFNIAGPRQSGRYGMVLPNFVRAAVETEPLRVFGDGQQSRNFTYIDDCVEALVRLLRCPDAEGEAVNIGGTEEISIAGLAQRVLQVTGAPGPIVFVPYEEAYSGQGFEDMRRRVPCLCKIRRLTGWSPVTDLNEMIRATADYERRLQQTLWPGNSGLLLPEGGLPALGG
jgi:UDP-glucose 4-epimerase